MATYLQSQQILKRCFNDVTGKLKSTGGTYTVQDYLNAVYDDTSDSLRISVDTPDGGSYWGEPVTSVDDLPSNAAAGTITPVIGENSFSFYYYDGEKWVQLFENGLNLTEQEKEFIEWGVDNKEELEFYIDHKDKIEEMLNSEFAVKVVTITLPPVVDGNGEITPVNIDVNGNIQNIIDSDDSDGDETTHYKIDINGYVVGMETYENSNSIVTDRYYTKEVYEKDLGHFGVTHIYMTVEEYDYFSKLENGKNVLKVAYLENMFGSDVLIKKLGVPVPGTLEQGVIINHEDGTIVETNDSALLNGYRYRVNGYVMSVETYGSNEAVTTDKCTPDIIDYNEGLNNTVGYTDIYLTKEAYEDIKALTNGKNRIDIYYLYQS